MKRYALGMVRGRGAVLLALVLAACGPRGGAASDASSPGAAGDVQTEVVYEKLPDGSVRKTTITKRTVPAPVPAARPADAYPGDPLVRYNVDRVNGYRAQGGLPPLPL